MEKISLFPNFVEINLNHKDILDNFFNKHQQVSSELNFAELFMWKNSYKTFLSMLNENLCILITHHNDKYFYPLIGNNEIKTSLEQLYNFAKQNNFQLKFKSVTEDFLSQIKNFKNINIEEDYCFYDYVYKTTDLIDLRGEKFHSKRNLIKQFHTKYTFNFLPITESNIKDCISFVQNWYEKNKPTKFLHQDFEEENEASTELLKNYFKLNLIGSIITINNEIIAITVASKLNNKTAVIHIEKAFKEYKGVYQTINYLFCKNMLSNYTFINREQDLCDEGLRKAKMSYYPYKIIEKKVVTIKEI